MGVSVGAGVGVIVIATVGDRVAVLVGEGTGVLVLEGSATGTCEGVDSLQADKVMKIPIKNTIDFFISPSPFTMYNKYRSEQKHSSSDNEGNFR